MGVYSTPSTENTDRVKEQMQRHSYTIHTPSTLLSFYNCHTENNVDLECD